MATKRPIALSLLLYLGVAAFLAYKRLTRPKSPTGRVR